MADEKVKVGVIGCGAISAAYLGMAKNFPIVEMVACADAVPEVAKKKAAEFNIPCACPVEELLKNDEIEIVLNLTIPKAHADIALQCIDAGKHVYSEKPLGINREEGRRVIEAAKKKGVRVGCAPDTFMGAGIQTARKLLDEGVIGKPVAFTGFMMSRGVESWHPNPEFYYEPGAGPMLDMGPYYLTAFLNLLGPIKRIMGMASIAVPERTITHKDRKTGVHGPKYGKKITVTTPDHVLGGVEFENGAVGTLITSFATAFAPNDFRNPITVYGTEGTMKVPDPNGFDGPVFVQKLGEEQMTEVPHAFVKGYGRSIGVADMAYAVRSGREHRANGDQALAVLDAMVGFLDSSETGAAFKPTAPYKRPAAMPADLPFGQLDR